MPQLSIFARAALLAALGILTADMTSSRSIGAALAQDSRLGGFLHAVVGSTAENVTLDTDCATYTIKQITLGGSGLSNADLATLLDPKAPTPVTERFAKLTASSIVIPEMTITTKSTPIQKIVYQNIKLTDVKQGKAATADIDGAKFTVTDADNNTVDGTYGHIRAQGLDLALASHIMNDARKDDSEPLKALYDSFSMDGFKMNSAGNEPLSFSIGSFSGHTVKARAFSMRPSEIQSAANDPKRSAALIRDIFLSFDMQDLTAANIEIHSQNDGKPVSVGLDKMTFANFGNAKIGEIRLDALAVNARGTSVKIGDISFKGIDFAKLRDQPATPPPAESVSKDETNAADEDKEKSAFLPIVSEFAVNKVAIDVAEDPSSDKKSAFSLDHFQVDGSAPIDMTPTQLTATLDHLILDLKMLKDHDVQALTDMGYSKLDLSSRVEMGWDANAEELTVKDVSISGADMGALKISGLVDNVSKDFFSGDSTAMQAAAFGALVKKIEIRIENAGLFEKAVATQAKAQNKTVDEIKKSYVAAAAVGLPAMLDNKPAAKLIGAALAKFLANPKSFHLIATSADGLGAADLALTKEPSSLLDAIEVKATANE